MVVIGVAAIILVGKTVPRVTCIRGVYLYMCPRKEEQYEGQHTLHVPFARCFP